ncbi:MAG: ATP-binding cassette domain-containing protein [Brevundimonas sp.]|uniref:amino acid ABC transporter ATP-binding/permease protein n=1 Tax=Brevundimonas sp. TaxID=1871086 RepID=UPI002724815D|nr:ATP-binding cassette domain-containing protein [Brevundimonas sp.]MDO9587298.1 ATP-binding cassette domain-containing protein [Brevundimonas sp.]
MSAPTGRIGALIAAQRRNQRRRLALSAAAGGVVAAASVGLLGLSGWFIAAAALAGGAGAAAAHAFNFLMPSAVIRLLAILRTGARYVERVSGHDAALHALARLRPEVFAIFATGRPGALLRASAGEVSSRLVQDIDALQILFIRLSAPWALATGATVAAALAWLAHPLAGLATVVSMAAAAAANGLLGLCLAAPAGREVQRAGGAFRARLAALEAAAPELKAYGLAGWAVHEVETAAGSLDRAAVRLSVAGGWMAASQAAITGLAVGATVIAAHGASTPLVALAALSAVTGVEAAGALAAAFRQGGAAHEAVLRLDELTPEPARAFGAHPRDTSLGIGLTGDILLPPARLAFVGPSGSGKTSLIERLIGLREPIPQEWRVGDADLCGVAPGAALPLFAYAAQDVRLLDGSVRDNLRLAAPGATDDDLWAALEDAAIAERVRASPDGLNMAVGSNGLKLSGGERRRLGLARAYLRSAPWLLLDEPTEGLDAVAEARVLERLDRRLSEKGQGLILISHRLGPVMLCERVIKLEMPVIGSAPACDAKRDLVA